MSDAPKDTKSAPAPAEEELDHLIRPHGAGRSEKKTSGGPTTQSGLDLANELVKLDRRAREIETTLTAERDAYAVRVRGMEAKLVKLEPWLKQLKGEFQRAQTERDALREQLSALQKAQTPGAKSGGTVSESALKAAVADADSALAARDAALADAASLRSKFAGELDAAAQRASAAETARDTAVEELTKLRKIAVDSRRADEEVRGLKKQIEQLETTTSAHKAVARAAQEAAETLQSRLTDMEKTAQRKAEAAQRENRGAQDLQRQLDESRAASAAAKLELETAARTVEALRGGEDEVRRELAEKSGALTVALQELAAAKSVSEKVHGDAAQAARAADSARAESTEARSLEAETRRRADQASAEASRLTVALETAEAELKVVREANAAAKLDAAEQRELAEEAMRAEMTARETAEERMRTLAAREHALAAAEQRSQDNDVRAGRAEARVTELESEVELVRNQSQSFATEAASLSSTLETERVNGTKRLETAETSWRSQMRAAESRFELELSRERERTREAEEMLRVRGERNTRERLDLESETSRMRASVMQFVAFKAQEVVAGLQRIVGDEPQVVPPITATMDIDPDLSTPTVPVVVPPPITGGWDKLMSDVEQLWTEVEGMRDDKPAAQPDTDSLTSEHSPDAGTPAARVVATAAPQARSAEPKTVAVEETVSGEGSKPKKRRR